MIRFRIIFLVMAILTLLLILAPLGLGLASAILTYHGMCYGFTDGSWACSWQEYASDQVFWCSLLEIPLSMYLLPTWLVALGLWFLTRCSAAVKGLPKYLVILIPTGGYFIGFCLISILAIFIRYFYLQ